MCVVGSGGVAEEGPAVIGGGDEAGDPIGGQEGAGAGQREMLHRSTRRRTGMWCINFSFFRPVR